MESEIPKREIPKSEEPKDYTRIEPINSSFIKIIDGEEFDVKMQYSLLNMEHAEKCCFIREEVYEKLLIVQKNLPEGIKIRILDAWRPYKLQKELLEKYTEDIIVRFNLQNKSEQEKKDFVNRFVSEPINNKNYPPVHTTGGAIDLTLLDKNGNELNMGTDFDEFTSRTYTDYYESGIDTEIRNNRRILYYAMINAGFTNLPSEWWHYDYGDRFWAFYSGKPAIYKGVFEREEINYNEV
ncbi:MAG: M15 family metallopeptidase [Lachnospirales bacterium]